MTDAPKRVLIATPTFDGKLDSRYTSSLIMSMRHCQPDYLIEAKFINGDAFLGRARDYLLQFAVDEGADILLWIDADSYWPAEAMKLILDAPQDYIGGLQRLKTFNPEVPIKRIEGEVPNEEGILKVAGIGFTLTKMSRRCFCALHDNGEPYSSQGRPMHRVFTTPIVNGQLTGEDFAACRAWQDLGQSIYAHTKVKLGHVSYMQTFDFEGLDDPF